MPIRDWFNNFFGFDKGHGSRDPEYDDEQFKRNRNNFSFTMNWPRDPFFSMMEDFMEGFSQNNIFVEQFPNSERDDRFQHSSPQHSLRDQVLKIPEEERFPEEHRNNKNDQCTPNFTKKDRAYNDIDSLFQNFFGRSFFAPYMESALLKEDTDLDADVQDKGLDLILKGDDDEKSKQVVPFSRSFHASESRTMIRKPDGSSEQRITKRLPDGTEETTIIKENPASGERQTEIRRSDGSVEVFEEASDRDAFHSSPISPFPSHLFHFDPTNSGINSFFEFFGK